MSRATRWLFIVAIVSLLISAWAVVRVFALERKLRRITATDTVAVPSRMDLSRSTAGIAPSQDGKDIVLWLGRIDSNAQTRMSVNGDGTQSLEFFDRRGKLRLSVGLDQTGRGRIQVGDENGKLHMVDLAGVR